ncbi:MAG: acyl-homoserine-lactone synthase [Chthoniobacterales bacterium]
MLQLITPENYHAHQEDLQAMYRLRHKIFFEQLRWDVTSENGMERDQYDETQMYYLIYKDQEGIIRGSLRLIEMIHECMFDGPFNFMLPNLKKFKKKGFWEISRLYIHGYDDLLDHPSEAKIIYRHLFAGIIHFGLANHKTTSFLAVSYPSALRLHNMAGMQWSSLYQSVINNEAIISAQYSPSQECYEKLIQKGELNTQFPPYTII